MKLGIVANVLQDKSLGEALAYFKTLGLETFEPGCGGYAGKAHVNPEELLSDSEKLEQFRKTVENSGLSISALSCHGNPIHPDRKKAEQYDLDMRNAVLLAEKIGVDTISCFSGCAGDGSNAKYPNWVTCSWPEDYLDLVTWQWNDVLIPYWKEFAAFAKCHGVTRIALELHPGFMVYNTATLLKLREAVGPEIGAAFDPSHLIWQGMDPVAVIRTLGEAVFHVHAKDVKVDAINRSLNGVLDTRHYSDEIHRSWIFRTLGYGHGESYWKEIFSTLRMIGYDRSVSIEHEDSLINRYEGLEKAAAFAKECMIEKNDTAMWWA